MSASKSTRFVPTRRLNPAEQEAVRKHLKKVRLWRRLAVLGMAALALALFVYPRPGSLVLQMLLGIILVGFWVTSRVLRARTRRLEVDLEQGWLYRLSGRVEQKWKGLFRKALKVDGIEFSLPRREFDRYAPGMQVHVDFVAESRLVLGIQANPHAQRALEEGREEATAPPKHGQQAPSPPGKRPD